MNGKKTIGNFDTGSNGAFQLTTAAVAKLGLTSEVEQAQTSKSTGFNGLTENHEGKVKNVTIGATSVDQPKVVFFGKGTGRDNEGWEIRIGNAFLKHFVFTVDYQNNLIALETP